MIYELKKNCSYNAGLSMYPLPKGWRCIFYHNCNSKTTLRCLEIILARTFISGLDAYLWSHRLSIANNWSGANIGYVPTAHQAANYSTSYIVRSYDY